MKLNNFVLSYFTHGCGPIYVCMYVRKYLCIYACKYVYNCVYVCTGFFNSICHPEVFLIYNKINRISQTQQFLLTLILPRSRTGTVWFYTSTSNKRTARPKLYTKSLTRVLKLVYSRLTLVRISINL